MKGAWLSIYYCMDVVLTLLLTTSPGLTTNWYYGWTTFLYPPTQYPPHNHTAASRPVFIASTFWLTNFCMVVLRSCVMSVPTHTPYLAGMVLEEGHSSLTLPPMRYNVQRQHQSVTSNMGSSNVCDYVACQRSWQAFPSLELIDYWRLSFVCLICWWFNKCQEPWTETSQISPFFRYSQYIWSPGDSVIWDRHIGNSNLSKQPVISGFLSVDDQGSWYMVLI